MLPAEPLQLLIGACFATCAAADAGDDFSNNLFSDLAPLLALFGERVTMQFMSQSTGWADNIILAMAPLGIITAIVGAIRVGGPSWLKAIIGRVRESRAIAESELMSSTSNEVCELWNGQEIVRVMGAGPIREFIILLPEGSGKNGGQANTQATTPTKTSSTTGTGSESVDSPRTGPKIANEMLAMELKDPQNKSHKYLEEHELTIRERISGKLTTKGPDPEKALRDVSNSEKPDENRPSVVIIRNTDADTPNLTLNVHNQVGSGELYMVAVCGLVLQLSVLVYSGFATYQPTSMLLKDGNPIANYAFPCTAAGTLLLVAGMLICSHVVEGSTSETRYRPAAGKEARVVWLQKSGTVNDQAFESFAIFSNDAQALVTTSQRKEPDSSENRPGTEKTAWGDEVKAVTATMVSICGFIVQFIGLRGMHWSASVAQLGATIVMAILRAWVRRNVAELPKSQSLLSGHEMDWLAMTFGGFSKAPWLHPPKVGGNRHSRPWDWRVSAVEDPAKCEKLRRQPETTGTNTDESMTCGAMRIRRDLGELADWHGPASVEAIALARAIEVTLDTLIVPEGEEFTWSLLTLKPFNVSGRELVTFRVDRRENRHWRAYSDEIEAALSLWLYSVYEYETIAPSRSRDDAWLRAKGTLEKPSLRLLGSHTAALQRDLQLWMPDVTSRVIEVDDTKSKNDSSIMEVESHRVVGFASNVRSGS
ncbi:hypothetical protein K469DRAFT_628363, partial [Zopfia rhizophila CBS 207.26]